MQLCPLATGHPSSMVQGIYSGPWLLLIKGTGHLQWPLPLCTLIIQVEEIPPLTINRLLLLAFLLSSCPLTLAFSV